MLAKFLQRNTRLDRPFPKSLSRSELVRNLSEFLSCLEWVAASGEGNYIACDRAAKILTALLDENLNGSWSGGNDRTAGTADNNPGVITDDLLPLLNGEDINLREHSPALEMPYNGGEDLWGWFDGTNVDFMNLGQEHLSHAF